MINLRQLEIEAKSEERARKLFQKLIAQLVRVRYRNAREIRPVPGDGGIDVLVGELASGTCMIWQAKYFTNGIGKTQKSEIRKSFNQVVKKFQEQKFKIDLWTLCVPCSLSPEETKWWGSWKKKKMKETDIKIKLMDELDIEELLLTPEAKHIRLSFFSNMPSSLNKKGIQELADSHLPLQRTRMNKKKTMTDQVKVFICYAREDENAAKRLFRDLKGEGLDPWLDMESLLPGQDWQVAIQQAIRESHYFLALLSSKSVRKRGFMQKEIREALDISDEFPEGYIFLIPVRLEDCQPPYQKLCKFQWVDMFPDWDIGLNKLLTAFTAEKGVLTRKSILQKADLEDLNKEILHYLGEKERTRPFSAARLSILEINGKIEISIEPVSGIISALKSSVFVDTWDKIEQISRGINNLVGITTETLGSFDNYKITNPETSEKFLSLLQKRGKELFNYIVPKGIEKELRISSLILETNMNDVPFELMWHDNFFALKYAMGRRLKIGGKITPKTYEETEIPRALIIADPEGKLGEAIIECDYLSAELAKLMEIRYIKHGEATYAEILRFLGENYNIIHYAGFVDQDKLVLSDKSLDFSKIEIHLRGSPFVFMSGSSMKIVEAFLRGGAIGYIGSLQNIHDIAAARFAMDFYTNSFQHTVGEAIRIAKERAFYENNVAWLCYILFGDPTLKLF